MRAPAAAGQTGPNPRTQSCPAARPAAPPKRTNVPGQQGRLQDLGGGRGGGGGLVPTPPPHHSKSDR